MDQPSDPCDKHAPIVLIIDDNPAIRNVVSWSLQLRGYEPAEAANGLEAIQWIEQAHHEARYPAVILLDLAMPGMNGEDFLQWLQNCWPSPQPIPPIIIITANYTDETRFNSNVKQIVLKPFHVRELLAIVQKWTRE